VQVVIPNMDESSHGSDCDSLVTLAHARDFVLVVCQNSNVLIGSPNEDFAILVAREKDVSLPRQVLVKHCEEVIFVICD